MSAPSVPTIDVARLEPLVPIGDDGRSGRLFGVPAVQINRVWPAVFKEYVGSDLARLDVAALGRTVALLDQIGDEASRWLSERAAWPAALVTRDGTVIGYLMRQVPEAFARPPSLAQDLFGELPAPAGSTEVRLAFLLALAQTLAVLERRGVTPGDLSPRSVLFASAGEPRCFLTGCDTMRVPGSAPVQAGTGDPTSALSLLVVRVLARDPAGTADGIAGSYPDLAALARRGGVAVADWIGPLREAHARAADPPPAPTVTLVKSPAPTAADPSWPAPAELPQPSGVPVPAPDRRRRPLVVGLVAVAVALALAGAAAGVLVARAGGSDPSTTTVASTGPTGPAGPTGAGPVDGTGSPSPFPQRIGLVDVSAVATDARAADIAGMFDEFFTAVNARDYARAILAYDPTGVIKSDDPVHRQRFAQTMATTTDTDISLVAIEPGTAARAVANARITFRSAQQPGYGPRGRESETCTRWDVTYTLTSPDAGRYRILGAAAATSQPC